MSRGTPAIACICVIGKRDHPLHISLYPPDMHDPTEFGYYLSSSLDIFEARLPQKAADHDFGLLQAIDENLAMYGWLTNTGIKFVIVVDMEGRLGTEAESRQSALVGLRNSDLKPAFKALHAAYIKLLRNPFYDPDDHPSHTSAALQNPEAQKITSSLFIKEMDRIAQIWYPGISAI